MRATESGVGLVSCACWDHHATIKWEKSGFLMVLLVTFTLLGLFLPYILVVARNMMPAFLPYISQSGGVPPSNGIFAVFMEVGLFFGAFVFLILFVSVNQRNTKNLKFITVSAKVIAVFMVASWLGLLLTVNFPVGYTDVPNKFQWVVTVLYEHGFSATLIIVGLAIFQYMLIAIWWYLPGTSKIEKFTKVAFGIIYVLFFLMVLYPLPKYLLEELGPNPFDLESMKNLTYTLPIKFPDIVCGGLEDQTFLDIYLNPNWYHLSLLPMATLLAENILYIIIVCLMLLIRVYTVAYKICAFCEWSLILLSIINIATHYKDLQKVSCRFVFRHKSCQAEEEEPAPSISLRIIT